MIDNDETLRLWRKWKLVSLSNVETCLPQMTLYESPQPRVRDHLRSFVPPRVSPLLAKRGGAGGGDKGRLTSVTSKTQNQLHHQLTGARVTLRGNFSITSPVASPPQNVISPSHIFT